MTTVSYTEARERLAALWDQAVEDREVIVVRRRGKEDLAMLPASELTSLMETAHLLRSPANAERLLTALARARSESAQPMSRKEIEHATGLE